MKRDILVIKEILNAIENDLIKRGEPFKIQTIEYSTVEGHIKLLKSANLIEIDDEQGLSTGEKYFYDISLTNTGYDFLNALNNKSIFSKISNLQKPFVALIPIAIDLLTNL